GMREKWAMLASLGAITCLMEGDVGQVARSPGGVEFAQGLFDEVLAAVAAAWRPLTDRFRTQVLALLTDRASALTSSMYRDMKSGQRVEVDQIVGDLVMRASARGVATPRLSAALVRLKVYEQGQSSRAATN